MYPKIIDVETKDEYVILVKFDNNDVVEYDLKPKLEERRFKPLKNKVLFSTMKIDNGGYGISWNDEVDLSEYELWTNGKKIS